MSELIPSQPLPQSEAEVIRRLTIRPERIKVTATIDDDGGDPRHWVELTYDIKGKLRGFGNRLIAIAIDVWEAGGAVVEFVLGTGLRPANEHPDDFCPDGPWRAMHVTARIRTRARIDRGRANMEQAIRDIVNRHKPQPKGGDK